MVCKQVHARVGSNQPRILASIQVSSLTEQLAILEPPNPSIDENFVLRTTDPKNLGVRYFF